MSFQEKFDALLAKEPTDEVTTPESGTITEPENTSQTPLTTSEEGKTKAPENITETPQIQQPDYNKFLEDSSGGLFKSVDEFKSSLPKITDYEKLKLERDAFEIKTKENPFANDYVKQFNDLWKAGEPQHKIDAFVQINKVGDLTKLDPFDVVLNKRILVDGYAPETATRMINREFGLNIQPQMDEDGVPMELTDEQKFELQDNKEKLRVFAQNDLKELEKYKADVSKPSVDTTELALRQEVAKKDKMKSIEPVAGDIAQKITGLGKINLNGEDGDKADLLQIDFSPEFKATIPELVTAYLSKDENPVTESSIQDAVDFVVTNYKVLNYESDMKKAYKDAWNKATAAAVAKYENLGGLPFSNNEFTGSETDKALRAQQKSVAQGRDD